MRIINLSSGSKGNLTYLETQNTKILVDDGLSCQETVKRLSLLGINPYEINAIVVSHEHSDHIKGIDIFSKKYDTPVFAHQQVWQNIDGVLKSVKEKNKKVFDGDFEFNDLYISPVEVPHDVKCFGFSFYEGNKKVSIVTDLGHINDKILSSIRGSQIAYIEANYDRNMLMASQKYPLSLKRRIDGPNGHLSNVASADAIERLVQTGTRQVVLSHLSEENNTPSLAYTSICKQLAKRDILEGEGFKIDVATTKPGVIFRLK